MGFKIDSSEFDKKTQLLIKRLIPAAAQKTLYEVANIVLRDANDIPPKTPKKWGNLKRDKFVQKAQRHGNSWTIHFGFNSPYARRLHEDTSIKNWTEPGSGNQYLRSKLIRFKTKYGKQIALRIKQYGGMR
jgi:hypothetical protein